MLSSRERQALDRHITGNGGEDQYRDDDRSEVGTTHPGTARLLADVAAAEDVVDPCHAAPIANTPPGPMAGDTRGRKDAPPLADPLMESIREYGRARADSARRGAMLEVAQEFSNLGMFKAYDVVMGMYEKAKGGEA